MKIGRDAKFSACSLHRLCLRRWWGTPLGDPLVFLMLNPSTADASVDDNTIRRCIDFARREGYSSLKVVNLFTLRATKPALLFGATRRNSAEADSEIYASCDGADVVAAWGANGGHPDSLARIREVLGLFSPKSLRCLGCTISGHPFHPLMRPRAAALVPWPRNQADALKFGGGQ